MKNFLILAFTVLYVHGFTNEEVHQQWLSFKLKHNKLYRSVLEERKRFSIFKDNLKEIEKHNALYESGATTYYMGVNHFSDLTSEEFMEYVSRSSKYNQQKPNYTEIFQPTNVPPGDIDWRKKGAVTPVKNQGNCGSCWSFSATGALEGRNQIKTGKLVSLSEQNLIDCSVGYGNNACDGGIMDNAFLYVHDHGITTEEAYPYKAELGQCQNYDVALKISGIVAINQGDELDLKAAVAEGPVSIAIDATKNLHHYSGGVFTDPECSPTELNHGVLAVGYGYEGGQNYWIIKNSWSKYWGDNGYFKIVRGLNKCGVATQASYPVV